jgi:DNA-binding transcriptional MerR regulator
MRIGQLAAAAGVTVQTVRFYERRGLIAAPARRDSGYREYSAGAVDELRKIIQLKALGFTLAEIGAALGAHSDDGELCRLAAEKVVVLEAEIRRLTEVLDALEQRRHACGCDRQPRFRSIRERQR